MMKPAAPSLNHGFQHRLAPLAARRQEEGIGTAPNTASGAYARFCREMQIQNGGAEQSM
jgi:hypothetical protein